ncbi:MAG: 2'-5' RNA ligase family protein, partial [Methanoregula sp.]
PFTPHATLARVKDFDPSLFEQIDLLKGRTYGTCTVSGLKLKKSTLTPRGPVYEDLLEVAW